MRSKDSVDGFVPRRSSAPIGNAKNLSKRPKRATSGRPVYKPMTTSSRQAKPLGETHRFVKKASTGSTGLSRTQIDESLKSIDSSPGVKSKTKRQKRTQVASHPKYRLIIKRTLAVLGVGLLLISGVVGVRAFLASSNIFEGNLLGVFSQHPLKTDSNGRSNILVFGTAEDSEGGEHEGGNLTDSIMVLSIDQKKKDAYMMSLPRDLWVKYDVTCPLVGNEGKLNAVYSCASNDGQDEAAGSGALRRKVGEVTGLDIQYYAHVNFTVVVEAVDAVGGVDVVVESDDPRGIMDRNFDWKCNYQCYYVKYENGEEAHMDGEHALAFIRARNAQGGYGLSGGNFDRERNQQKVMVALRDKALSAGTLTNVGAVTGLINTLGNNLRTNFETAEIRTLMSLASEISADSIRSLSLDSENEPLVSTGERFGQSIVLPIAGLFDYGDIQSYVQDNIAATPLSREKANILVLNGTTTSGLAGRQAEQLKLSGFRVGDVGNAPQGSYADVEVYAISSDKPETTKALKNILKVEPKTTTPPLEVGAGVDFVIIYGSDPADAVGP